MEQFFRDLIGNDILATIVWCVLPLFFILGYAIVAILAEMKSASWIQDRLGPMRTGPWGIFQPFADVLKLLMKEDIVPEKADRILFNLAPVIVFVGAYAAFAVLPFASDYVGADLNIGLFYLIAVSSFGVLGIIMGGWASNNKYSLLGAMRSVAQIVSYEVPSATALLVVAMLVGSLNLQDIVTAQSGGFWNWFIFGGPKSDVVLRSGAILHADLGNFVFLPLLLATFVVYYLAALAETNRTPFDIPEGESELVGGYHTEYSGMKFGMFFMAEYANMFLVSAVAGVMFFGGWQSPWGTTLGEALDIPVLTLLEGVFWTAAKGFFFVFVMMWLRWTLPRLRVDQLMYMCWKVLIPLSFALVLIVGFLVVIR